MAVSSPAALRKQLVQGKPDPIYLLVGDDDVEMTKLTGEFSNLVEEELRAFNLERIYAADKGSGSAIVESARTLPMMGDRRVIVVLRAEKLLKPKRRGRAESGERKAESGGNDEDSAALADAEIVDGYVKRPESTTTLVLVASDVDRTRKLYKSLQKTATIIECWGLRHSKDEKVDLRQVARVAEGLVKQAVADAGLQIDPAAARLVAERAGADIATLRGDVERLLLYAAGKKKIEIKDVQEVVSSETSQDDWAVTNAIARGDRAEALRQLGLAMEAGGVSYQILGQLGWFVREKLPRDAPQRLPAAIDALFRADLELKSSGGDPRVLLERLVVELCRR